jgi:hypothetical protein
MNSSKPIALVASTVRNGGSELTGRIARLDAVLSSMFETRWMIVESDSEDNTVPYLLEMSNRHPKIRAVSMGHLRHTMPLRTQRIAHCRNHYVHELLNTPAYSDVAYLVVLDLDEVNDELSEESLSAVNFGREWAGVFANQRGPYYDLWALRHPAWCPGDCWRQYEHLKSMGVNDNYAHLISIASKMLPIDPAREWIEVDSAFGGLGIYRREFITPSCRYVGLDPSGPETCEHVSFNEEVRKNGGRLYVLPGLTNAGEIPLTSQYMEFIKVISL